VLGVGGYRSVLKLHEPAVRAHAATLRLATVQGGDTWWTLAERLSVPVVELRLHNPFLAARPLRAGQAVVYPQVPRDDLFAGSDGHREYVSRLGDNYLKLAFVLGITPDLFRQTNALWRLEPLLPGSTLVIPPDPAVAYTVHRVEAGESLATIASAARVDPWWIVRDNYLWSQQVREGMNLRIRSGAPAVAATARPALPIVHRVQRGETLTAIARRYGTTVGAIQAANQLGRRTRILVGQRLSVPRR
jgi:LysM repeat protein